MVSSTSRTSSEVLYLASETADYHLRQACYSSYERRSARPLQSKPRMMMSTRSQKQVESWVELADWTREPDAVEKYLVRVGHVDMVDVRWSAVA